jgi:hypothetical protein
MAETYLEFSRALMDSQRPADLQAADLEEYELALEEEAFPFEEKAIDVHEKNLELLRAGVFNAWTEKSLGKLAELMPGRYAKNELSSGFVGSMDSYAYRSPALLNPGPGPGDAQSAPQAVAPEAGARAIDAPSAADGEVVAHANP